MEDEGEMGMLPLCGGILADDECEAEDDEASRGIGESEEKNPGVANAADDKERASATWKRSGVSFYERDSLGMIYIERKVHEPLRAFNENLLKMAGYKFDEEQSSLYFAKQPRSRANRSFRGLVVSMKTLEREFMDDIRALMLDPQSWEAMPPEFRRSDLRSLTCRKLSDMGGVCQGELIEARNVCPHRTLLTIQFPEMIDSVDNMKECMWDELTEDLVKTYGSVGDSRAIAKLQLFLDLWKPDTVPIEARNSWLRNTSMRMGCQTHAELFDHLSAKFSMHAMRRLHTMLTQSTANSTRVAAL
jgi:hypothetical protein